MSALALGRRAYISGNALVPVLQLLHDNWACHATDGPPKIGPPGPSVAIFIATGGPPD